MIFFPKGASGKIGSGGDREKKRVSQFLRTGIRDPSRGVGIKCLPLLEREGRGKG